MHRKIALDSSPDLRTGPQSCGSWYQRVDIGTESVCHVALSRVRTVTFASWLDTLGRLEFVRDTDPDKQEFFVPRVIEQLPLIKKKGERKDGLFPEKSDEQAVTMLLGLKLVKNGAVAVICGRKTTAANLCGTAVDLLGRQVPLNAPVVYSDAEETKWLHFLHSRNLGLCKSK